MPATSENSLKTSRIGGGIAKALNIIAVMSSAIVVGLMFFLVVARYLLGLSVVGLHELIMLAAVALYMTGAVISSQRREHLTVDWIAANITDPRKKAMHALLIAILTIVVSGFFIVWSYYMFTWGMKRPQTTPAYQIPLWIPQFSIGMAAIGCFAYALRDAVVAALHLKERPRGQ